MPEIRKKIELLQKIAHRFNEANIEWALVTLYVEAHNSFTKTHVRFSNKLCNFADCL